MDKDLKRALELIQELLDELPWHPSHEKVADKAQAFVNRMEKKHFGAALDWLSKNEHEWKLDRPIDRVKFLAEVQRQMK